MKKISLEDLVSSVKEKNYEEQYKRVMNLLDSGQIKPIKASGLNGKKPALYQSYWLLEESRDLGHLEEELKYRMSPVIKVDYYLSHLKVYQEDRPWVLLMDEFLKHNGAALQTKVSMNERSFEIWYREKFLKQEQGLKVLSRMGISLESLNLYETTEPLPYYSHTKKIPQNILIIENKDTFYTMRRYLMNGGGPILGVEIGTLIYGSGKGILRSFKDFSLCVEPYINDAGNTIFYFGDLDYEGIRIYEKLSELFQGQFEILPMRQAYKAMLERADDWELLPDTKAGQNRRLGDRFWNYFEETERKSMDALLRSGKYIPQEILTIHLLSM